MEAFSHCPPQCTEKGVSLSCWPRIHGIIEVRGGLSKMTGVFNSAGIFCLSWRIVTATREYPQQVIQRCFYQSQNVFVQQALDCFKQQEDGRRTTKPVKIVLPLEWVVSHLIQRCSYLEQITP